MFTTIKKITVEELYLLTDVIKAYLQYRKEKYGQPEFPMKERLKNQLTQKTISIFADVSSNEEVLGFIIAYHNIASLNIVQNKINYKIKESNILTNQEKKLFKEGFNFLKEKFNAASIMGEISDDLRQYIIDSNFRPFKRARMKIIKETILALNDPELPLEYSFRPYDINMRESLVDIIIESHFNGKHSDGKIWRHWETIEGCKQLLQQIENNIYGQFSINDARVLTSNEKAIGVCFVTTLSKDTGYIPEIAISNLYKEKGLGKSLLVHSIKHFNKTYDSNINIELDVTIDNKNALKLYENIGFKPVNSYFIYAWNGE